MIIAGQRVNNDIVTEIGKFAILWNHFEHFYCNNRHGLAKNIKIVADSIKIDEEKMNIFREALNNRMESRFENTITYVSQGLHPTGSNKSSKENKLYMEKFINNDNNQNNIIGCLLVIGRIRNNMMHGLKDISELNGQLELFQSINGVLEDLSKQ